MNPSTIALIVDLVIGMGGGLVATLCGFRVIGPPVGMNAQFDALHARWLKHLKWLGPLCIVLIALQGAMAWFAPHG